jgi:hypothetical protein
MMMASSEERMKILQMIQDEKISAEDGAKLLAALSDGGQRHPKSSAAGSSGGRYMRVRVTDSFSGKTKVSVNLPLGLIDAGLSIASNFMPGMDELTKDNISDAINTGMTGKIVDVQDDEDGEHIEIYIE